jgi:RNA methyltransferase, TrmH family
MNNEIKQITSPSNPIIKDIKSLNMKKYRSERNEFLAEGLKLIIDALNAGWILKILLVSQTARGQPIIEQTVERAQAKGAIVLETNEKVTSTITKRDNPQAVIGVLEQKYNPLSTITPKNDQIWLALDRVRDPGNLGTIMRTVDAVGGSGVILIGDATDPFALETVRATMGSLFVVPLYRASENEFLTFAKTFNGITVGTHLKGAVDYRSVNYQNKSVLLIMGNEQSGLSQNIAQSCHKLVKIPQLGQADSLNLAVATGVTLFEIRRHFLTLETL